MSSLSTNFMSTEEEKPSIGFIPIYWHNTRQSVDQALVDLGLRPHLAQFNWYLSDLRVKRPPKTTLRVKEPNGTVSQFNLLLNRLVYALHLWTQEQDRVNLMQDRSILRDTIQYLPRIRPANGDAFDCRFSNLQVFGHTGLRITALGSIPKRIKSNVPPLSALKNLNELGVPLAEPIPSPELSRALVEAEGVETQDQGLDPSLLQDGPTWDEDQSSTSSSDEADSASAQAVSKVLDILGT